MSKNYADWHSHKSSINAVQTSPPYFHEREIWWVAIGLNVGYEVDGKSPAPTIPYTRPVIICKKFSGMFYGIPLSTQIKSGPFYHPFTFNQRPQVALLSQMRAYDAKRLVRKMGMVGQQDFAEITAGIIKLLT